jgi:hypothetical protein
MDWLGVRTDVTPVADMPGAAEAAFSVRLRKAGELQRRWGFLSSAIAQQSGPIRYIVASNRPGNNFITLGVAGSPQGFAVDGAGGGGADPWPPPPDGPKRRRPRGDQGTPAAPTIISVDGGGGTYTPPYPSPTFTAQVNYDGLSGPLFYQWSIGVPSDIFPALVDPTAETLLTDCSALGTGIFTIRLRVETAFNPAFFDEEDASTVTFWP